MDLKQMWDTLPCELTDFVNELALFLTSVCKTHRAMLEGGSGELYIQLCEYIPDAPSRPRGAEGLHGLLGGVGAHHIRPVQEERCGRCVGV